MLQTVTARAAPAGWGKKVVFVLNKADLLSAENGAAAGDLQAVCQHLPPPRPP